MKGGFETIKKRVYKNCQKVGVLTEKKWKSVELYLFQTRIIFDTSVNGKGKEESG